MMILDSTAYETPYDKANPSLNFDKNDFQGIEEAGDIKEAQKIMKQVLNELELTLATAKRELSSTVWDDPGELIKLTSLS